MFSYNVFKILNAYLFSAMLGLPLLHVELSLVVVRELLIAVVYLVVEHRLCSFSLRTPEHRLITCGIWAQLPGSCEIFLDNGSNPCLLHCKGRFLTPEPPGKPHIFLNSFSIILVFWFKTFLLTFFEFIDLFH